jgi:hypothetical protein
MNKSVFRILLGAILLVVFISGPALAAKQQASTVNTTGNDVSYPQCGKTLPFDQAFGVVGVNGGLANTTNSCLATQLSWAAKSTGVVNQPKIQLYVNTANPGGLNTPSWPSSNTDPAGNSALNPYGNCDGSDSLPCAWLYGWNRSVEDVLYRFAPAAQAAGVSSSPAAYVWWLDVETINTWKSGSTFATQSNAADLEGMGAYFKSLGASVGLYSTTYQWGQIAGTVSVNSNLNGLPNWRPGARNLSSAKSNCGLPPLTAGGKVTITQYLSGNLDYDYSCV